MEVQASIMESGGRCQTMWGCIVEFKLGRGKQLIRIGGDRTQFSEKGVQVTNEREKRTTS